jgi:hypothetical protein
MITAVAGMTADANILINYARQAAQQYLLTYNSDIPCEQLVRRLCDLKQGYTQHGGLRPFGVSFIYAGWDNQRQFQLYQSNPSGNYGGWKATSVGANNASAQSLLKQDYNEDCNLKQACELAVKVRWTPQSSHPRKSSSQQWVGRTRARCTTTCGLQRRLTHCSRSTVLASRSLRSRNERVHDTQNGQRSALTVGDEIAIRRYKCIIQPECMSQTSLLGNWNDIQLRWLRRSE